MARILILGGTTEARELAGRLAGRRDFSVTISLAGRTAEIVDQKAPTRVGGFGGAEGLADWLRDNVVDMLVDATHPYAEAISRNAVAAATRTGVPLLALRRPAWERQDGAAWIDVADVGGAVTALGDAPRRVFLALGRQEVATFEAAPAHFYLVRSVDPVDPAPKLPDAAYVVARGPFTDAEDRALMEKHGIGMVVSRNSGGAAAYGKIAAAHALGIPVVMIRRPPLPPAETVDTVEAAAAWLDHAFAPGAARGV